MGEGPFVEGIIAEKFEKGLANLKRVAEIAPPPLPPAPEPEAEPPLEPDSAPTG